MLCLHLNIEYYLGNGLKRGEDCEVILLFVSEAVSAKRWTEKEWLLLIPISIPVCIPGSFAVSLFLCEGGWPPVYGPLIKGLRQALVILGGNYLPYCKQRHLTQFAAFHSQDFKAASCKLRCVAWPCKLSLPPSCDKQEDAAQKWLCGSCRSSRM